MGGIVMRIAEENMFGQKPGRPPNRTVSPHAYAMRPISERGAPLWGILILRFSPAAGKIAEPLQKAFCFFLSYMVN